MMERGYVDRATRQSVTGWAFNAGQPDDSISVRIYINGDEVAEAACICPRDDLRQLGNYGHGRHGFSHDFCPPLPNDTEIRITVRCARSLRLLGNGDIILGKGSEHGRQFGGPLNRFRVPPPKEWCDFFKYLLLYDQTLGLDELLSRMEFGEPTAGSSDHRDLISASSDRDPIFPIPHSPELLRASVRSAAFRQRILELLLAAFPEKQRIIFLHIPKCAGTDLLSHLAERMPFLNPLWESSEWTDDTQLLRSLAGFIRDITFSSRFMIGGHVKLSRYIDMGALRSGDEVFTVLRSPAEIIISQLNYVLWKFELNAGRREFEPDVRDWLSALGLHGIPPQLNDDFVCDAARLLLHNQNIVRPNPLSHWLGGGDTTALLSRLAEFDVELTTLPRYEHWLAAKWQVTAPTRKNASKQFISFDSFDKCDKDYLMDIIADDGAFYEYIDGTITRSDVPSVHGKDLI